ncbi:MAG: GGDEF domain-containing protein [Sphingomicrobium sp.]
MHSLPMGRFANPRRVSDATYLELVRTLFGTVVPGAISAGLFIVTSAVCAVHSGSPFVASLAVAGSVAGVARLGIVVVLQKSVADPALDPATARQIEHWFGAIYLTFAVLLGLFAASGLRSCPIGDHIAIAALVVGYGAGVAAGVSLRPWIGVPAIIVAVVPTIVATLIDGGTEHRLLGLILIALLAGGVGSILHRYRHEVEMIEMRQRLGSLARTDPLTGLANRLTLEEAFAQSVAVCGGKRVALHCFDLDRFKPVNDIHGHIVGDQLLQAVANRLARLLRRGDFAVRLGGDEFAVLQTDVEHRGEAQLMARRIARAIAEPYGIAGKDIRIGASVGSAWGADHGPDLAQLLKVADEALYDVKLGRTVMAQAS